MQTRRLPLAFEANTGQFDNRARFVAHGAGGSLFLTATEAVIALPGKVTANHAGSGSGAKRMGRPEPAERGPGSVFRMKMVGAGSSTRLQGVGRLPGIVNYFIGNDPGKWHTNVPTYRQVRCSAIYPGTDLIYYGNGTRLEYDFVLRPGADPKSIRLAFAGADRLQVAANGDLVATTASGEVRLKRPYAYQVAGGSRVQVACSYALEPRSRQVALRTARYDRTRPLVVDPGLEYSTYLGGSNFDVGSKIQVDSNGAAYVAGETSSVDFPVTTGAYQSTGAAGNSAFVTKLNSAGTGMVYSTYLGGSGDSYARGIAVDASGAAYVTGASGAAFPTTAGAFQTTDRGGDDCFVAKLSPTGAALNYSTYVGGANLDCALAIAVDASGAAYLTGLTSSTDFPVTSGAYQTVKPSLDDEAFITKINASGTALVYSTYLGGTSEEYGNAIAVDAAGRACVVGATHSGDFPVTSRAFQTTRPGVWDGFVAILGSAGSSLAAATYLGADGIDSANDVALDSAGSIYVAGKTDSLFFPVTTGAYQTSIHGFSDAFVAKLPPTLSSLTYCTYLGGTWDEDAKAIAVDGSGNAYVLGYTSSYDFPTTPNAFQRQTVDGADLFVTRLEPGGGELAHSTYLGGSETDTPHGIALDHDGLAYVLGEASDGFPTTLGALKRNCGWAYNATITKLYLPRLSRLTVDGVEGSPTDWITLRATLTTQAGSPLAGYPVRFTVDGVAVPGSVSTTNASGVATRTYQIPADLLGTRALAAAYAGDANYGAAAATATLKSAYTTTITASDATGSVGAALALSAALTATSPSGTGNLRGATVSFSINGATVGTAVTGSNGVATLNTSVPEGLGSSAVIGTTYAGADDLFGSSDTATLSIGKGATTLAVANTTANTGNVVSLAATLTNKTGSVVGRMVTITVDGSSSSARTGADGVATVDYTVPTTAAAGPHAISAAFEGDPDYLPSSGSGTLTVYVATRLQVADVVGATGATVTLSATLSELVSGTPVSDQIVQFAVDGAVVPGSPVATNADGVAVVTYTVPALATPGSHTIEVSFIGATGYDPASGKGVLTVQASDIILLEATKGAAGSTVTLSASLLSIDTGRGVQDQPVHFSVDGAEVTGSPATTNAAGVASLSYTIPTGATAGSHDLAAEFRGDSTWAPASAEVPLTVTVPTTLTVGNGAGPTGGTITLRATLKVTNGAPLSGKPVTFKVGSADAAGSPATTNSSGVATLSYTIPAGGATGTRTIEARFPGDDTYGSATGTGTLTVTRGLTKLYVAAPTPKAQGAVIRIYSYLQRTPDNGNLQGRSVAFKFNGLAAGTGTTDANGLGEVYYTIPAATPVGSVAIQADFAGDNLYAPCTKSSTATVTAGIATSMSGNNPGGGIGTRVKLYAYLFQTLPNSPKVMVAGKNVDFYVDSIKVGTGLTDANGYAQYFWQVPVGTTTGSHTLVDKFVGDTTHGAASRTGSVTVSARYGSSISMGSRQGVRGLPVHLYCYLWKSLDGSMLTGRSVTFQVDGADVGSATTDANGYATFAYTVPMTAAIGVHPLKATYAGDSDFDPATGSTTLTVAAKDTITWSMPAFTAKKGARVTLYTYVKSATTGGLLKDKAITFKVDGATVGNAITTAAGYAGVIYTVPTGAASGAHAVLADFAGDNSTNAGSKATTLTVP